MSQSYLNGPSVGRAISAEEFVTGAAGRLQDQPFTQRANDGSSGCGCGCGGMDHDCPGDDCRHEQECCCQQMLCCCRPVSEHHKPPQVEEGCCCKESFRAALGLLCDQQVSNPYWG